MRANLVLSALLIASPLAAQTKAKKAAPKAAPAPVPEAPKKIDWDGDWALVPGESTELAPAIEEHVKDLNFFLKKLWKKKIEKACTAYTGLFVLSGENMSVTYSKNESPVVTPGDGGIKEWKRSDGEEFKASLVKETGRFTQTLDGDGYKLSHTFAMRPDGDTLTVQVSYVNPKCPAGDFGYRLVYKRKG